MSHSSPEVIAKILALLPGSSIKRVARDVGVDEKTVRRAQRRYLPDFVSPGHEERTRPPTEQEPAQATRARPGTVEKVAVMASRLAQGEPLHHLGDAPVEYRPHRGSRPLDMPVLEIVPQ
jgi:transposase-like protein